MVDHPEGKKPPTGNCEECLLLPLSYVVCWLLTVWEVNMANKNSIVLLYEFCQIYLHTSPDFSFTQSSKPPHIVGCMSQAHFTWCLQRALPTSVW